MQAPVGGQEFPDKMPAQVPYFKALTGIRAIAAYLVFFHHFNLLAVWKPHPIGGLLFEFVEEWHIGVTIFFVLSGFLIGFRYSEMKNFSFRNYLVNRIARIYPMYFLLTLLTFAVLYWAEGTFDPRILFINLTFLKGFFEPYKFTGIAQGWSLTVEETFYFLAPLFFVLINRSRIWFLLAPALLLALGVLLVSWFSKHVYLGFFSSYEFLFNYTFFGRCSEFFLGIGLAYWLKSTATLPTRVSFTYLGLLGIVLSIVLLVSQREPGMYGVRTEWGKVINSVLLPAIGILPLFWGLLKEETLVSRFLGSEIMVLLGKSSYIFYLIHLGPFMVWLEALPFFNPILGFVGINLISIVLFTRIEEPLNHLIRRRFTLSVNG